MAEQTALPTAATTPRPAPATADGYRLGQRPALDGLRAIAVAMVLYNHTALPHSGTAGTVGVTVFFVLSGFLITRLLLEEWDTRSDISLSRFYIRRALRLMPAMVAYVAVTAAVAVRYDERLEQVLWAGLYVTNIVRTFGEYVTLTPHTWSLAMEEQFYLVWPALMIGLLSVLRLSRRGLALALVAMIGLSLAYRYWLVESGATLQRLHNDPLVVAFSLLVGCLLAVVVAWRGWRLLGGLAFTAALGLLLALCVMDKGVWVYTVMVPATTLASAVAILVVVRDGRGPRWVHAVLTWAPLRGLGRISYGLYLWHYTVYYVVKQEITGPDQVATRVVVEVLLSVAVATLSYHLLESKFLKLKDSARWSTRVRS
jgi:peptidoglycan/LPS O-acetylase OafA/YrhL